MKRTVLAPILVLSVLMTGCFTTVGAVKGSKVKEADGSTDTGAVVGYALLGAAADAAVLYVLANIAFASAWGNMDDDGIISRTTPPGAPVPSPLSIPR